MLRQTTYESGERRLEEPHSDSGGLGTTTEAARRGERAGWALLEPDHAPFAGGHRAEWHSGLVAEFGQEYTYRISYWLPTDWDQHGSIGSSTWRIIYQFHEARSASWSPIYGIQLVERNGVMSYAFYRKVGPQGPDRVFWSEPINERTWIDFAINVKWTNRDDGFVRFYRNGQLVYEDLGIATLETSETPYPKWGIYGQPTRVLFDEVLITEGGF